MGNADLDSALWSGTVTKETTGWQPIETAPRSSENENDIWIWAARRGSKLPMLTTWDHDEQKWYTFNLALETGMRRRDPCWKWEPDLWMLVQEIPQ